MRRVEQEFVGFWRLRSFIQESRGGVVYPYGEHPVGVLAYDHSGLMSVHLSQNPMSSLHDGVVDPAVEPIYKGEAIGSPFEKLEAVFDSYLAYWGTYAVDWTKQTVTHNVIASNRPTFIGRTLVRKFEFRGANLRLSPPAPSESPVHLLWQPARAGGGGLRDG